MRSEVEAAPLADWIGTDVYHRIVDDSADVLDSFHTDAGAALPVVGNIVVGRTP